MKIIKVKPSTLVEALQKVVKDSKIGWTTTDHRDVVKAILDGTEDENGQKVTLPVNVRDIIMLACAPTHELKKRVINTALATADIGLDQKTQDLFDVVSDMAAFSNFLAKAENPSTKRPYIVKEKKSKKRDALESLLGSDDTAPNKKPGPDDTEQKNPAIGTGDQNNGQPTEAKTQPADAKQPDLTESQDNSMTETTNNPPPTTPNTGAAAA